MKIKRFVAADMRQAMREVREEQGPDAVILSTRRMDEGIEIIAAVDFDEALVREAARHGAPLYVEPRTPAEPAPAEEKPAAVRRGDVAPPPLPTASRHHDDGVTVSLSRRAPAMPPVAEPVQPRAISPRAVEPPMQAAAPAQARASVPPAAPDAPVEAVAPVAPFDPSTPIHPLLERAMQDTARVRAELGSLRDLLETQLSSLIWNDMERRQPLRARVLREMTRLGIESDVARQLVDDLPNNLSAEQARYLPLGMLSRSLSISRRDQSERPSMRHDRREIEKLPRWSNRK